MSRGEREPRFETNGQLGASGVGRWNGGTNTFPFDRLADADLLIDAVYRGGDQGHSGADPIQRLLRVGIGGGFRYLGSQVGDGVRLCALYSTLDDPDWPDALYPESGRFIYFGDNRRPGHDLHNTKRKGNSLLARVFAATHNSRRDAVPPFLVFTKVGNGRDVAFRGLAVPGAPNVSETDDLIAVWRTTRGQRFQNYQATFTILAEPRVTRLWIEDLLSGHRDSAFAPEAWRTWVKTGRCVALEAPKTAAFRTRSQQLPNDLRRIGMLDALVAYFKNHPRREYAFEKCAVDILRLMDKKVGRVDLTRPWKDGGRDAVGEYRLGTPDNSIVVEFALEAKCKTPSIRNSSGVKETARLIARLRHRQFGVFVTTSCVHEQAYAEIIEDAHPVLVLTGADIIAVLEGAGISTDAALLDWLQKSGSLT